MQHSRLFSLLIVLVIPSILGSRIPPDLQKPQNHIPHNSVEKVEWTLANINNLASWISWDGSSAFNPWTDVNWLNREAGTWYPRGTATVVYQDGLMWGGFVKDGRQPELRTGGQNYAIGTVPGKILSQGIAEDPSDPAVRIYRIRRDYQTVSDEELLQDAAEFYNISPGRVTGEQLRVIREQYARDWQEWPADRGAPFYDNNLNGIYEPSLGEEPGLQSADQVIWFICNDLDSMMTLAATGSPPMGVECQVTVWGYKTGGPLGQTIFRRYRLINKSGVTIDSMFVTQFSDADVGDPGSDLCGCDSVLNLGYVYNQDHSDELFDPFSLPPPAIGYCLLQGPVVPSSGDSAFYNFKILNNSRNLPMTSFQYYLQHGGPAEWNFPDMGVYDVTLEWYNIMNGYLPRANMYWQVPFTHRATGKPTRFPLNGDPVAGTGDIDGEGSNFAPGRIISFSSGPFQMSAGDTQEVVIAVIGGIDPAGDNISSVARLKQNVRTIRKVYQNHLIFPATSYQLDFSTASISRLSMEVNLSDFESLSGVRLDFRPERGNEAEFQMTLYDDGQHNDGAAGDGKWGNVTDIANRQYPYQADLLIDHPTVTDTIAGLIVHLQLRPSPVADDFSIVSENGRQDGRINYGEVVHLAMQVKNPDMVNPIHEVQVSAIAEPAPLFYVYRNDQDIPAGGSITYPALYAIISAPTAGDSVSFRLLFQFDGHLQIYHCSYPITPWQPAEIWRDTLEVSALAGPAYNVLAIIADPTLLTGHEYLLTFSQSTDSSDQSLRWGVFDRTAAEIKLQDQLIIDSMQCNHPVVDGVEYQVYNREPDFRQFLVVANAAGVVDPAEQGCFAFNANGFPLLYNSLYPDGTDRPDKTRQQTNGSGWGIHTGMYSATMDASFDYFKVRTTRTGGNWPYIIPYDFEMRFTAAGGQAQMAFTSAAVVDVPFELWNIGIATPDDASDDYRLVPLVNDADINDVFNLVADDHTVSGGTNDPYTDWIYWYIPDDKTPGQAGYDAVVADGFNSGYTDEAMARMVLVNWDGGSVSDPTWPANVNALLPEEGTIFRILTYKNNQAGDSLLVRAPNAQPDILYDWPQQFQLLQNYPNPFNSGTTIPFELSEEGKVRIEIYNILGQQVVVLKDEPLKKGWYSLRWDGKNRSGIPIASGVYVVRMEIKDIVRSRKIILLR